LVLVGLSHREAGVEVRERLAFQASELETAISELCGDGILSGLVVVSTCNRLECYAGARDAAAAQQRLREFLVRRAPQCEEFLFSLSGAAALRHLFRVASGLDSIVVGEHQILSQVKESYQQSVAARGTDKILNKAFQAAFAAGKAVRARTGIAQGITSCGAAAVALAEKILSRDGAKTRRILLLGAGKTAQTAAQHLLCGPAATLTIANRDLAHARELAGSFNARAVSLEEGMASIHDMDVLIASTACPHYIVTRSRMAELTRQRGGAPLVLIDLGVPRNIDPTVAGIPGVHLYNIDDLETIIADSLSKRRGEIAAAESISAECALKLLRALKSEQAPGEGCRIVPTGVILRHAAAIGEENAS
jgi:glutamyl-tRNA reductase